MVCLGLVQRHDLGMTDRLISGCMRAKKHDLFKQMRHESKGGIEGADVRENVVRYIRDGILSQRQ